MSVIYHWTKTRIVLEVFLISNNQSATLVIKFDAESSEVDDFEI